MEERNFNLLPDEAHIDLKETIRLTGVSRASIYRMMDAGEFPTPVPKSVVRTGRLKFYLGDLKKWLKGDGFEQEAA